MDLQDQEMLVDLVQSFPNIWDKKHSNYKDILACSNSWQSIAAIMEKDGKKMIELGSSNPK